MATEQKPIYTDVKGALALLGRSRSWLCRASRLQIDGFPRPLVLGGKNAYRVADLIEWIERRPLRQYSGLPAVEQE